MLTPKMVCVLRPSRLHGYRSPWTFSEPEAGQKEIFSSWALFILIMLLIIALFASYMLQHKKIQAIHETVLSIFAGTLHGPLFRRLVHLTHT